MNVDHERTCIYLQEGGVTVKWEYKDCRVSTLNGFCRESSEWGVWILCWFVSNSLAGNLYGCV